MTDEAPRVFEDCIVLPDGRVLPRIRGGEIDQQAPEAAAEETPTSEAAPGQGTPAQDDSEYTPERARGLHAELTKAQQKLAEQADVADLWQRAQQGDTEAMRELRLPLDFGDEGAAQDGGEEQEDDVAYRDPRVDELEAREQQREQQRFVGDVRAHIDTLVEESKIELPEPIAQALLPAAFAAFQTAGNRPLEPITENLVNGVTEAISEIKRKAVDDYIASKRGAPRTTTVGTGATEEVLPLDATHAQRVAWMNSRLPEE